MLNPRPRPRPSSGRCLGSKASHPLVRKRRMRKRRRGRKEKERERVRRVQIATRGGPSERTFLDSPAGGQTLPGASDRAPLGKKLVFFICWQAVGLLLDTKLASEVTCLNFVQAKSLEAIRQAQIAPIETRVCSVAQGGMREAERMAPPERAK